MLSFPSLSWRIRKNLHSLQMNKSLHYGLILPTSHLCSLSNTLIWYSPKRPDCLDILKSMTLSYYTDDIILIRLDGQEVESALEALLRHAYSRRWRISLKLQRPATLMKCLEIQWSRSSKIQDKLFHPVPPTPKKEVQCLVGLYGLWRPFHT